MDRVVLNVGGKIFHTTRSTLLTDPQSMLAKMFDTESMLPASVKDENGAYFIDRDPKYFRVVLNFLRDPTKLVIDQNISIEGVLQEAIFFQIHSLTDIIQQGRSDFSRSEICLLKVKMTGANEIMKFSGTRLNGLDLSGLHLNATAFDSTKTQGSNADFSETMADNAKFTEAQLLNCNFNKSHLLKMSNFWLANLTGTTFINADCTGTIFHKCDLTNVDFTNANLKQAKFQGAKLYNVDFNGAKLDNCYLSKSDLTGAKNIDWTYHSKMTVQKSTISQSDYDAIPLTEEEKILLKLIVV